MDRKAPTRRKGPSRSGTRPSTATGLDIGAGASVRCCYCSTESLGVPRLGFRPWNFFRPTTRWSLPTSWATATRLKPTGDYWLGNFANLMRDLLVVLDIERTTVIGQSLGGGVAVQFAYQFPDRCEGLVLVDAGGLGREVNWILRLVTLPAAEYVMPVLFPTFARPWGDSVARLADRVGIRSVPMREVWRSYRSPTDAESRQAFARTMRSVINPGGQSVKSGPLVAPADPRCGRGGSPAGGSPCRRSRPCRSGPGSVFWPPVSLNGP